MNEFSQSVPVPICEKSIQRRLSNLWLSQENCCENTDDFVENRKNRMRWCRIDYTGQYKNNGIKYYFLLKYGVNQVKFNVCMCGEKQKKGGTRNA